ncbi:hypothetical protein ACFZC3_15305 [Streptomyces sp. NPDC007903]
MRAPAWGWPSAGAGAAGVDAERVSHDVGLVQRVASVSSPPAFGLSFFST